MKIHFLGVILLLGAAKSWGIDDEKSGANPHFVGPASCSSSSCHGGADERSNQNLIWSRLDFHSRSFATLTSARSERFAEVLKLGEATQSARCTVCHAPFQTVPPENRLATATPALGVACESCHGAAESWLRAHTRPDFSHVDRVAAGMRDLKSLYVRANTCVACHQTVESDLAAAGHPELIFELDGQSASEPRHWRDTNVWAGPQAWFVGQAVALREISWQLSREKAPDGKLLARWHGLLWLLQNAGPVKPEFPDLKSISAAGGAEEFQKAQKVSDDLARQSSEIAWNGNMANACLKNLAATFPDFRDKKISRVIQARRAERLVIALDRLIMRLDEAKAKTLNDDVNRLFKLSQSIPDFSPEIFAKTLEDFSRKL